MIDYTTHTLDNLDSALRNVTRGILTTECGNQLTQFCAREQQLAAEYERRHELARFEHVADQVAQQLESERQSGER